MNKKQVKKVLLMLDRINQEIDILGNMMFNASLKPVPIKVKDENKFRVK
jgi:hypothetical protein